MQRESAAILRGKQNVAPQCLEHSKCNLTQFRLEVIRAASVEIGDEPLPGIYLIRRRLHTAFREAFTKCARREFRQGSASMDGEKLLERETGERVI